jgi:hypothetical protein
MNIAAAHAEESEDNKYQKQNTNRNTQLIREVQQHCEGSAAATAIAT